MDLAAVRRSTALRISAATAIDRATAAQISHCPTSSLTVFITVWKMPRTVDRTSKAKDPLVVMKTVSLDVQQWLICIAVALSIVVVAEIRKAVLRQTAAKAVRRVIGSFHPGGPRAGQ